MPAVSTGNSGTIPALLQAAKYSLTLLLLVCISGLSVAASPANTIQAVKDINQQAWAAQATIDRLFAERQSILSEINIIEQEGSAFAVRNQELQQAIQETDNDIATINSNIAAVAEIQSGISELLTSMLDALDRFIDLDLPFRLEQRRATIAELRLMLEQEDRNVARKYQAVVAAYLNEIDYGFRDEIYSDEIETATGQRFVQILKLGRAGLWYLSADGTEAGFWQPQQRRWVNEATDPAQVATAIESVKNNQPLPVVALPVSLSLP